MSLTGAVARFSAPDRRICFLLRAIPVCHRLDENVRRVTAWHGCRGARAACRNRRFALVPLVVMLAVVALIAVSSCLRSRAAELFGSNFFQELPLGLERQPTAKSTGAHKWGFVAFG